MSIGKNISFFANGINLAGALKSFSPTAEVETLDSTVLNSTGAFRTYVQGFKNGNLSAEGVWSYDTVNADEIDDVFKAAFANGSEVIITASMETLAIGGVAILMNATEKSFSVNPELGQLIMVSAEFQSNNAVNFGKWHFSAAVNNTTTNGTAVDNAAASANGGILHVHAQNPGGFTVDAKVQHSTDSSVWVDLATTGQFDNINSAHSATVAVGVTVNRYTRVVVTTSGGSATIQAAFARR